MAEALIECVPNFAEGREPAVMYAILSAMRLSGVLLLDYSLDPSQHRSVITIAGPPEAVCEAAIRAVGVAAERIDLTQQTGTYPRMGSADVLPFVPVRDIALAQCAVLARETARALWERYSVPSYLYAAAASRPDRAVLEDVRRGQFEGLREAVLRDAGRRPDVGGPGLHPTAGATAIGARRVLIEYLVTLDTGDLGVARSIARAVRQESSGLSGVKALALLVRGRAQVALGITDFQQSSVSAVYALIQCAAQKQKAPILHGELVGLIPEAAYEAGSEWVAGLKESRPEHRILEHRLENPLPWPSSL